MITPTVLLVDDERNFLETLGKRLSKRNIEVTTAFTGNEALAKSKLGSTTDVVVLDLKMPCMDGLETLKRIKLQNPLVEVILLTGHATLASAVEAIREGAFDYLVKPCDLDDLVSRILAAAKRRTNRRTQVLSEEGRRLRRQVGA